MKKTVFLTATALAALNLTASNADAGKCYGIAKKGENNCGDAYQPQKHDCAGQSTEDYDSHEWKMLPKDKNCTEEGGGKTPEKARANPNWKG